MIKKAMYNRSLSTIALPVLLLIGSHNVTAEVNIKASTPKVMNVERAIILADMARKKAASVEGEWRDTRRMINQARIAIWKGELKTAMELAGKAQEQAELGYAQAVRQMELTIPSYLQNQD